MRVPLRLLRRAPTATIASVGMTATAIVIATLAIVIFDAGNYRRLPFAGGDKVVVVYGRHDSARGPRERVNWSFPRAQFVGTHTTSLELAGPWRPASLTMTDRGVPTLLNGEFVATDYFSLLDALPVAGRVFSPEEGVPGRPTAVVVIADAFRQRRARMGDTIDVGARLRLNGHLVDVIGVMAAPFEGLTGNADFWMPIAMAPVLTYPQFLTTNQDFITLLARPRRGVSIEAVENDVDALVAAAYAQHPADIAPDVRVSGSVVPLAEARLRPEGRRAAGLLLGGGAVLFLLALANLAALQMSRAIARRREAAVALAMGAGPLRLWGSLVVEPALVIGVGAVLALFVMAVVVPGQHSMDPIGSLGRGQFGTFSAVAFDARLVAWWTLVTVMATAAAAMAPAMWATRRVSLDDLRAGARGSRHSGLTLRRPGTPALILGAEAALAVILMVAAAHLLDSYRHLQRVDLGVETSQVLTFEVQPSESAVPPSAAVAFVDRVLESIREVPGVVSASVDGGAPLSGSASTRAHVVGRADDPSGAPLVLRHYVGPDHFSTLGIPLLAGRTFTPYDREGAPGAVIISEGAARQLFPEGNAIGQRVWFDASTMTRVESAGEIVGIVGDVKYDNLLAERTTASFYTPYKQFTYGWRVYFVKAVGAPASIVPAVTAAVARAAPDVPLRHVRTLDDVVLGASATPRHAAQGAGALAVLGLLLAVTGIWAVVTHAMTQRTREIAIRMAHGATTTRILRLAMTDGLSWPAAGVLAGIMISLLGSSFLRAWLYAVDPGAPGLVLGGGLLFFFVAALACAAPAARAAAVDPVSVLRAD